MTRSKKKLKNATLRSPKPDTLTVMRAIRKTQSLNTKNHRPSSSSPKSMKTKLISENLQKELTKKRKRVKVVTTPNNTEGLKLLKRGCVTMHRIVKRKIRGNILTVSFNAKGEPFGDASTEMQSYIGVLARSKPPIWHDTWKDVPKDTKTKIWECVQTAFVVPPSAKKMILNSACSKWREFKSRLTKNYILPYLDQPEMLVYPPADYSFIEKSHWDIFVAHRTSKEFMKIHEEGQKRRLLNKYPHRMSRKGYANLENEWSESHPEIDILDRATAWVLARMDENGNFLNDDVAAVAKEIERLKKEVLEGKMVEIGVNDVLTKALGKSEHGGRVRGQGSNVRQSVYFDLPRQKKSRCIDQRIREGVQKFMAEETPKIIKERDDFWAAEMEKLKAELLLASPNVGSQQASSKQSKCEAGVIQLFDTPNTLKQQLYVDLDGAIHEEKKSGNCVEEKKADTPESIKKLLYVEELAEDVFEADNKVVRKDDNGVEVVKEDKAEKEKVTGPRSSECQLAIGSLSNIVAYANIYEVPVVEGLEQTVHGVSLAAGNARVSITRFIQSDAKIPFPVGDEIVTVQQAMGSFIAWPRDLIVAGKSNSTPILSTPKRGKKTPAKKLKQTFKTFKEIEDCEQKLHVEMDVNYPVALNRLWTWANEALSDGRTIVFELSEEAFGLKKKQAMFLSDIHAVCSGGEMTGSVICLYIHFLNEHVKKHKMANMIAFVDPGMIGPIGCGNLGQRSRALAMRFKDAKKGQYFLIPYNDVNHWTLTVANPEAEIVYHMDPLKRRIANGEWVEVVDNGIRLYKEHMNKQVSKKKVLWENMAGVPVQTGTKECGLFLMRYMKEICYDKELDFVAKWMRRSNLAYTDDDINEIRIDFAKYFMKRHAR